MATKVSSPPEATGSSKAVRDAVALSKESVGDSGAGSIGQLNEQLIKNMANEVAFLQVQTQKEVIEANSLEARKKRLVTEQEIDQLEHKGRISAPVSQLGGFSGVGPVGMQQLQGGNAEVIKAALSALESDEARLAYLEKNKHLLYGGAPGMDAFSSLLPKPAKSDGNGDIGSILTGLANMQLVQGQEQRNSLLALMNMQKQLAPPTATGVVGSPPGYATEDTKLMIGAILKLAESFSGGQNQMQQQIAAIRDEKNKNEQVMWEKYFDAQRQADEERRKNQEEKYQGIIGSLQEKIDKMEQNRLNDGGVRGELQQLRTLMEKGKEFGLNLTNQTPDQERLQNEYNLELAKLNMEKEMMMARHDAESQRSAAFNAKLGALGTIVSLGYDAMSMKKKLKQGDNATTQKLVTGV